MQVNNYLSFLNTGNSSEYIYVLCDMRSCDVNIPVLPCDNLCAMYIFYFLVQCLSCDYFYMFIFKMNMLYYYFYQLYTIMWLVMKFPLYIEE